MDYPIQPISVIEAQCRAAALAGACPIASNPYAAGHWSAWGLGFLIAAQGRGVPVLEAR
jgi:hypothetical protein